MLQKAKMNLSNKHELFAQVDVEENLNREDY